MINHKLGCPVVCWAYGDTRVSESAWRRAPDPRLDCESNQAACASGSPSPIVSNLLYSISQRYSFIVCAMGPAWGATSTGGSHKCLRISAAPARSVNTCVGQFMSVIFLQVPREPLLRDMLLEICCCPLLSPMYCLSTCYR